MGNTWNKTTSLWEVDTAETLVTKAPGMTTVWVQKIVMYPNAADDTIVFQDSSGADAIKLKAGATDESPVHIDFGEKGRKVQGLTCSALSTSVTADVYLK